MAGQDARGNESRLWRAVSHMGGSRKDAVVKSSGQGGREMETTSTNRYVDRRREKGDRPEMCMERSVAF